MKCCRILLYKRVKNKLACVYVVISDTTITEAIENKRHTLTDECKHEHKMWTLYTKALGFIVRTLTHKTLLYTWPGCARTHTHTHTHTHTLLSYKKPMQHWLLVFGGWSESAWIWVRMSVLCNSKVWLNAHDRAAVLVKAASAVDLSRSTKLSQIFAYLLESTPTLSNTFS